MKHNGLQVKEIPIIFRGTVENAKLNDPDLIVECESFPNHSGNNYWVSTAGSKAMTPATFDIYSLDTIFVEYNGFLYGPLPKYVKSGGIYVNFGAPTTATGSGNVADFSEYPFVFSQVRNKTDLDIMVPAGTESGSFKIWKAKPSMKNGRNILSADLTGNGQLNHFRARFACGENGTLHLRPYVILNGNIRVDLCNFAAGGDQYIAGDNEEVEFDCYVPVETHAVAYVEAENVGEYPSIVDAAMTVQYEDFVESESIVGYEGVNLRRGRR